ncbi:Tripartite-type tricarboxylate transporter, receptor component TctC [Variovorax sp. HW608]|uniref:Bug family tripartite tricarboxylate transporter substrate binding protein n=1 Tax=Variovorax sp. HW608 TaxID=1034889 RepID=UPI00081FF1AB|nr:tripartite tricarboxylate transporter substrate-binding protein [Variovorax sp. HW608]SCK43500.1 Tripartite-type tricarboxylate transporter, receptor component TctC [Variovorax sp. HW608]
MTHQKARPRQLAGVPHPAVAGVRSPGFARAMRWLLAGLCAAAAQAVAAQGWPAKPIRISVPYAVGQGTDIVARYVGDELGRELHQAVIVDNRPGAGGNIGTQAAARSPADGYTLLIGTNATHAANGFLYGNPGFDPQADFEPVAMVGILPLVYVTQPASAINGMQDLVRAVRAKPEGLNVAISTTTCRVAQELLKSKAGAAMFPVDFKGSAQALTAVIGGQVEFMVDTITSLRGAILNQQVKPLGVTSASASKLLPGVKSLAEQGIAGYELVGWTVFYAPKGTPPEVLRTLSAATQAVLARPATHEKLLQLGMEPRSMTPEELRSFAQAEREKWGSLIRAAGLKPAG